MVTLPRESLFDPWPVRVERHLSTVPLSLRGKNRLASSLVDLAGNALGAGGGVTTTPGTTRQAHIRVLAGAHTLDDEALTWSTFDGETELNRPRLFTQTVATLSGGPSTDVIMPLTGPVSIAGTIEWDSAPSGSTVTISQVRGGLVMATKVLAMEVAGTTSRLRSTGQEFEFRAADRLTITPSGTSGGADVTSAAFTVTQLEQTSALPPIPDEVPLGPLEQAEWTHFRDTDDDGFMDWGAYSFGGGTPDPTPVPGQLAIIQIAAANEVYVPPPAGWTVLLSRTGSNFTFCWAWKLLDAGDIASGVGPFAVAASPGNASGGMLVAPVGFDVVEELAQNEVSSGIEVEASAEVAENEAFVIIAATETIGPSDGPSAGGSTGTIDVEINGVDTPVSGTPFLGSYTRWPLRRGGAPTYVEASPFGLGMFLGQSTGYTATHRRNEAPTPTSAEWVMSGIIVIGQS